ALSVCVFHLNFGILRPWTSYCWLGVEVFFVISGFIVPYSMARAGYRLTLWPQFMMKRLIRLEPPYLVSIALVMVLGYASTMAPDFRGLPFDWQWPQLLAHIGYINAFVGWPWLNGVYWSLAIEFQFYMLIGLALPALLACSRATRLVVLAITASLPLLI